MADVTFDPAEFKQVPLDFIISAPLKSTIEAHKMAAFTTIDFVKELLEMKDQEFTKETQKIEIDDKGNATTKSEKKVIKVPYLTLTKIPSLNFDSLSVEFDYSISQIYNDTSKKERSAELNVTGSKFLSKFVNIGLSGSVSNSNSTENTINKSGKLHLKLNVSETGLPQGLEKVLNWMLQGIESQTTKDPKS